MKKQIKNFTLVEMLTVVAIISILAALVIPTVIIAQNKGRVTQAKSDISSILTALKQLKSDYNRVLVKTSTDYYIGEVAVTATQTETFNCSVGHSAAKNHTVIRIDGTLYDAMIAELSAPKNSKFSTSLTHRSNKRKKVYLDPQNGFDPTANYDTAANLEVLWRDPWGNPYVVFVGVDTDHALKMKGNSKTLASGLAAYSFGPNGVDDNGCNVELDTCQNKATGANHKLCDDIASWNM